MKQPTLREKQQRMIDEVVRHERVEDRQVTATLMVAMQLAGIREDLRRMSIPALAAGDPEPGELEGGASC